MRKSIDHNYDIRFTPAVITVPTKDGPFVIPNPVRVRRQSAVKAIDEFNMVMQREYGLRPTQYRITGMTLVYQDGALACGELIHSEVTLPNSPTPDLSKKKRVKHETETMPFYDAIKGGDLP